MQQGWTIKDSCPILFLCTYWIYVNYDFYSLLIIAFEDGLLTTEISLSSQRHKWFKCALALHLTKPGIEDFIKNGIRKIHRDTLSIVITSNRVPAEPTCSSKTSSIVLCPTRGICNKRRHLKCTILSIPW